MNKWHIEQEVGWLEELVWTLWRREKYLCHAGNRNPTVQPIARHYID
jgi:hypothetical protein